MEYPARLRTISFPNGVAEQAARVCRRVAGILDDDLDDRENNLAPTAQKHWEGTYRDEFDRTLERQVTRLRDLASDLRDFAGKIDDAIEIVESENRRRASARDEFDAERGNHAAGQSPDARGSI